uniref:probable receptor-like protein kinase At5g59700 n=1 Tax=Erigeron canadensis TaxID=72917 RepID=UPI001CB9D6BA|nr:probable receptor-like protein kinase At5g59700 [Erigeron canadensis]
MSPSEIIRKTYHKKDSEALALLSPTLDPLRIPYEDILSATSNFANDKLIKRGEFSEVYRGKLLRSKEWIDVVIRSFRSASLGPERIDFLREIQQLSELNHTNALSFVGFCDEDGQKIMVCEYQHNGSLDKYISDPTALPWLKRLKICLGAARFFKYIHEDLQVLLHYDFCYEIKSSKILLDRDWEAKVFCFGFHLGYKVGFPHLRSRSRKDGSDDTKSHMSDVYSFGVLLFELVCGKKADVQECQSLARMGKLEEIINPDLRKQLHPISLSILSQLAYDCVLRRRDGPHMSKIVETLQQASGELPLKREYFVRSFILDLLYIYCLFNP